MLVEFITIQTTMKSSYISGIFKLYTYATRGAASSFSTCTDWSLLVLFSISGLTTLHITFPTLRTMLHVYIPV